MKFPHPKSQRYPITELKRRSQQQLFALEYVANDQNLNATCRSLEISLQVGKHLLGLESVRSTVANILQRHLEARGVTTEAVISELSRVAFAKAGDFIDENGEVDLAAVRSDRGAAVAEIATTEYEGDNRVVTKRKVKLHDKLRALELLGRNQTMFTDKVAVEGLDNLAEELKAARERVEQSK